MRENEPNIGGNNQPEKPKDPFVYDRTEAVSADVWRTQLAFDRDGTGNNRETQARNSGDWQHWYNNYVNAWNNASASERYAIDQQHGFFGGTLSEAVVETPPPPPPPEPTAEPRAEAPPPPPPNSVSPPEPEEISPEPEPTSTNAGSDLTPEDNTTVIDSELVDVDDESETTETLTAEVNALSQDTETNVEDDSLLTVRDVTPQDEVVDPATGTRYPSPADARRAGITNWVWARDYNGAG